MRTFIISLIILCCCLCALQFSMNKQISNLKSGIGKQELIEVLGKPDGCQNLGNYEALKYPIGTCHTGLAIELIIT